MERPEIWGVQDLGASAVALRLVVKTEPSKQWAVERELRMRLKVAFDKAGIEIPFPQQTVWHRNVDAVGHEAKAKPAGQTESEDKPEPEDESKSEMKSKVGADSESQSES